MGDDRGIGYREGKRSIYRASGIGRCLTQIVAHMLEYDPHESGFQAGILADAAREGNLHEESIVERLIADGYRIDESQLEVEVKIIPNVYVRGHTDGLVFPPRGKKQRVLEVKTMSKDRFRKWEKAGSNTAERMDSGDWEGYAWQISLYMHALNMPAIYVVKNRDSGKLIIDELKVPPIGMPEIKKKIILAEKYRKLDELPECVATGGERFFCPFGYLHMDSSPFAAEPDNEDAPIDDAQLALIAALADQYNDLASQIGLMRPMDDERKDVGQKLIAALEGAEYAYAGQWKIKDIETKRSYPNQKKLAKALGIDVEELKETYWDPSVSHYPKVTKREVE